MPTCVGLLPRMLHPMSVSCVPVPSMHALPMPMPLSPKTNAASIAAAPLETRRLCKALPISEQS